MPVGAIITAVLAGVVYSSTLHTFLLSTTTTTAIIIIVIILVGSKLTSSIIRICDNCL